MNSYLEGLQWYGIQFPVKLFRNFPEISRNKVNFQTNNPRFSYGIYVMLTLVDYNCRQVNNNRLHCITVS